MDFPFQVLLTAEGWQPADQFDRINIMGDDHLMLTVTGGGVDPNNVGEMRVLAEHIKWIKECFIWLAAILLKDSKKNIQLVGPNPLFLRTLHFHMV